MNEREYLPERFEEYRTHLRAVAYRMLKITEIEVIGNPARLVELDVSIIDRA
jgi:hypothetical protein